MFCSWVNENGKRYYSLMRFTGAGQVSHLKNRLVGVGGLAALANKDSWQARPRGHAEG